MAPRIVGELTGGMAHGGHIHHKNYEFTGVEGPVPASTFSHGPDLRPRDLGPVVYGGCNLEIDLHGTIPKFTYIGGPIPSPITSHGKAFHLGSQRPIAHGELTQGMAPTGHILLGNHKVIHTNGTTPITSFYPA